MRMRSIRANEQAWRAQRIDRGAQVRVSEFAFVDATPRGASPSGAGAPGSMASVIAWLFLAAGGYLIVRILEHETADRWTP